MKFLTSSGCMITLDNPDTYNMTLMDITQALSTTYRYRGQSPDFYSVLYHSYTVYKLVKQMYPNDYHSQLYALLHDVEEFITGDIPTGAKDYLVGNSRFKLNIITNSIISNLLVKENLDTDTIMSVIRSSSAAKVADLQALMLEVYSMTDCKYKKEMIQYLKQRSDKNDKFINAVSQGNNLFYSDLLDEIKHRQDSDNEYVFEQSYKHLVSKLKEKQ